MWFCACAICAEQPAFLSRSSAVDIAKQRPVWGLVHLRAGASMIDLVDINGVLGKKAAKRPILIKQMSITSACASIRSTKRRC